jgi:hypothetical protein
MGYSVRWIVASVAVALVMYWLVFSNPFRGSSMPLSVDATPSDLPDPVVVRGSNKPDSPLARVALALVKDACAATSLHVAGWLVCTPLPTDCVVYAIGSVEFAVEAVRKWGCETHAFLASGDEETLRERHGATRVPKLHFHVPFAARTQKVSDVVTLLGHARIAVLLVSGEGGVSVLRDFAEKGLFARVDQVIASVHLAASVYGWQTSADGSVFMVQKENDEAGVAESLKKTVDAGLQLWSVQRDATGGGVTVALVRRSPLPASPLTPFVDLRICNTSNGQGLSVAGLSMEEYLADLDFFESHIREYRALTGRCPPPGFDRWLLYARKKRCLTSIANYTQIDKDLKPFRNADRPNDPVFTAEDIRFARARARDGSVQGLNELRSHRVSRCAKCGAFF